MNHTDLAPLCPDSKWFCLTDFGSYGCCIETSDLHGMFCTFLVCLVVKTLMKLWPYSLVKVQCAVGLESQISYTELRIYGILEYIHLNIQSVLYARGLNKSH